MKKSLEIYIDGACRGNPGEAALGIVVYHDGKKVKEISRFLGQSTNNTAEYASLIYALQEALVQKADKVTIFTDSELVYRQVIGQYAVKQEHLKKLYDQVAQLKCGFPDFNIIHINREQNKEADRLASSVLRKLKQTEVVAPVSAGSGEESPSSKG